MKEKQSNKAVYSTKEKALLASLVENYKDKLESKKTDGTTNSIKNEAWKMITEQYNSHDVIQRTSGQLKKCWENMKYKTRKADTQARYNMLVTGGGPPEKDTTDILDDMVRSIVPTIDYTINNVWDSTGIMELERNNAVENDLNNSCVEKQSCSNSQGTEKPEDTLLSEENLNSITFTEDQTNTPRRLINKKTLYKCGGSRSTSEMCSKRKRFLELNEEKELRIKKLKDSIEQQKELHLLKMEAVQADKLYWTERKKICRE